jgi:hypothetical protein
MEKEKLEGLLIDYIDNKLNSADRQVIEEELVRNPEAYKLYEELKEIIHAMDQSAQLKPSNRLAQNFHSILEKEIAATTKTRTVFFQPVFYRVAAAVALLILGVAIGFWISRNNANNERLAIIEKEMEATRKQLQDTKQMMLGMLTNELSASQRIQGVNVALKFSEADDDVVQALLSRMNDDPNTNVRLAALDALSKFYIDPDVRKALIASLPKQKDPMVQITLIQLMVRMQEKGIVKDLQRIVDDAGALKPVKDEAYSGILKLS